MRITKPLPSLANVAAGSTATLSCPVGSSYDKITFEYSGVTRAQLKNITLEVNGKPILSYADGDQLQSINDYYGRDDNAGFLSLYFARPELENTTQQRWFSLGTADVQTVQAKIDIDAGATSPVISAHAVLSPQRPSGLVTKVKRFPGSSAVSGQIEIDNIVRGPDLLAVHIAKADVSDVEVEIDSRKIVDGSKSLLEVLQKEAGRVPQSAGFTHVDWCLEGDYGQAVGTANARDFRVRPTLDTSGSYEVVVEYADSLAGI